MVLRYTIFALGLSFAATADAQIQQPHTLQGRKVVNSTAQTAPQPPHALAVLRETPNQPAPKRLMPIVFQDVVPDGPVAAPDYAEAVPQPEVEYSSGKGKGKGYCSNCKCYGGSCGCHGGLRGRIQHHHMYYFGYDPEAWVRPFGDATLDHLEKQVANGVAARMTFYSYDFAMGRDQAKLNIAGWKQLTKIADLAQRSDFPIVIEATPENKGAGQMRRQAVLDGLRAMGSDIAADRVVIAEPVARGVSGEEALIIYNNLLDQTQSRGDIVDGNFTTGGVSSGTGDGTTVVLE